MQMYTNEEDSEFWKPVNQSWFTSEHISLHANSDAMSTQIQQLHFCI